MLASKEFLRKQQDCNKSKKVLSNILYGQLNFKEFEINKLTGFN